MAILRAYWERLGSLALWMRSLPVTSDREHVFITGAPRSGTTLVKTILTAHPAFAGGDYESTGLFKLRNFYQYTCGEIENGWIQVSCEGASDLVDFYDQLADALLAYYEGEYFVDKIWPRKYRLKYVVAKFPQARWVHMVRDGRDSYCSAREHPNVPQGESLRRFARYWRTSNRLVERFVPEEQRIRVRYEDLTRDPDQEIPQLMTFLGGGVEEDQFHPAEAGKLPSIHDREWHQRLAQPLDTRSVGRSKDELSRKEREWFNQIAEERLQEYGYLK